MDKIGNTLLLLVFVLLFVLGAKMALKIADPQIRKIAPSLADAIKSI